MIYFYKWERFFQRKKHFLTAHATELSHQFFLPVPSENYQNLDFELRYPAGDFETTRRDTQLFFLFRELRLTFDNNNICF